METFRIREQPENAESAMVVTPVGIVIAVRPEQFENALSPMLVTLSGISIAVKPEQFANALAGMLATPAGMANVRLVAEANLVPHSGDADTRTSLAQPEKALTAMASTLAGIVTDVRPGQSENAFSGMLVTLAGMEKARLVAEANRLPHTGAADTRASPKQPEKASFPTLATLAGIETDANAEQSKNASCPMLATPSGIETDTSPEQPENAESPMPVTVSGISTETSPVQFTNASAMLRTGWPPSVDGTDSAPVAGLAEVTVAFPSDKANVHVTPPTVSISARSGAAAKASDARRRRVDWRLMFIWRSFDKLSAMRLHRERRKEDGDKKSAFPIPCPDRGP